MIPKVIHYCWLSEEKKPRLIRKCMKTWRKVLPDYEIKCWNASNFDLNSVSFVKEAVEMRKWAFASDYIRLYALYTEGGIYLDSDVLVLKRFDKLLEKSFFTGVETRDKMHSEFFPESAIMGAEKGNEFIKLCLEAYQNRSFVLPDGSRDFTPIPTIMLPIMVNYYGWIPSEREMLLRNNAIVLSTNIIANSNYNVNETMCLYHCNNGSWMEFTHRGVIFQWFRDHHLMSVFHVIEQILIFFRNIFLY